MGVVYQPNPENPSETIAVKEAWVESKLYGIRSAIKNFGIERFKNNCVKATEGFNYVLERIQTQQNSLREMGHVKLAEFHLKKDHLKLQYNEKVESIKELSYEKVESIKEKSSAQWNRAKETAKESAKKRAEATVETAKKGAEIVKASAT